MSVALKDLNDPIDFLRKAHELVGKNSDESAALEQLERACWDKYIAILKGPEASKSAKKWKEAHDQIKSMRKNAKPTTVDLSKHPPVPPDEIIPYEPGAQLTIGDTHGNTMKLIYFLIERGVLKLEKTSDYEELAKIYQTPTEHLTKAHLNKFNEIINKASVVPGANIRFIGDEVGDRGANDYFTLKVLQKLNKDGAQLEHIFSDHGSEFVRFYEKGYPKDFKAAFNNDAGRSVENLNKIRHLLEEEPRDDLTALIREQYLRNLNLISYTIDDNKEITLFHHTPTGIETIKAFAEQYGIPFKDKSPEELAETINKVNEKFRKLVESGKITQELQREAYKETILLDLNEEKVLNNYKNFLTIHPEFKEDLHLIAMLNSAADKTPYEKLKMMVKVLILKKDPDFLKLPIEEQERRIDDQAIENCRSEQIYRNLDEEKVAKEYSKFREINRIEGEEPKTAFDKVKQMIKQEYIKDVRFTSLPAERQESFLVAEALDRCEANFRKNKRAEFHHTNATYNAPLTRLIWTRYDTDPEEELFKSVDNENRKFIRHVHGHDKAGVLPLAFAAKREALIKNIDDEIGKDDWGTRFLGQYSDFRIHCNFQQSAPRPRELKFAEIPRAPEPAAPTGTSPASAAGAAAREEGKTRRETKATEPAKKGKTVAVGSSPVKPARSRPTHRIAGAAKSPPSKPPGGAVVDKSAEKAAQQEKERIAAEQKEAERKAQEKARQAQEAREREERERQDREARGQEAREQEEAKAREKKKNGKPAGPESRVPPARAPATTESKSQADELRRARDKIAQGMKQPSSSSNGHEEDTKTVLPSYDGSKSSTVVTKDGIPEAVFIKLEKEVKAEFADVTVRKTKENNVSFTSANPKSLCGAANKLPAEHRPHGFDLAAKTSAAAIAVIKEADDKGLQIVNLKIDDKPVSLDEFRKENGLVKEGKDEANKEKPSTSLR